MNEYFVRSPKHSRSIKASSLEVAAKRFLNYLRRYTEERPTILFIHVAKSPGGYQHIANATVEWYKGKLKTGTFQGAEGEWYELQTINKI